MSQYYQGPHGAFNQQFYNKISQFSESNNSMSSNQYDDYTNNNGNNYNHGYNQSQSKQQHQSDMIRYHNPNLYNQQYNQTQSNSSYQSYTNTSNKSYPQNPNQNQYDQAPNYNHQLSQSIASPRAYNQGYNNQGYNNQGYNNQGHNAKGYNNNDQQQSQQYNQKSHYNQQYNYQENANNNNNTNNNNKYNVCDDQEYKEQIIPSYNTHPNQNQNQNQNGNQNQNDNDNKPWKQPDHTTHRVRNQYHPKQSEQFVENKKAHIYNMRAHLENGILSVEVYDAIQRNQWRAEFTQNNFQNLPLYTVAKVLVDAINTLTPAKNKISVDGFKPVSIQEYNGLCYLTVNGAQIPQTTFGLYPYNSV